MITERDLIGSRCFTIENGDLSLTVSEYGATAMSLTRDGTDETKRSEVVYMGSAHI